MKAFTSFFCSFSLLLLVSCGSKSNKTSVDDTQKKDSVTSLGQDTIPTSPKDTSGVSNLGPSNWSEKCNGNYENKMGTLVISNYSESSKSFHFKIETAGQDMCTGEIEGDAKITEGDIGYFEKWYEQELCGIRFTFDGKKTIGIDEDTNCLAYHGEECPFGGTYKRK